MSECTVLIISGLPCSGKSNLAARLQSDLRWPLLAKDAIKENLFDSLGWRDREWSRRLSWASYALMFAMAEQLLANGVSCILEGNFRAKEYGEVKRLLTGGSTRCLQILCKAQPQVLLKRYVARAESGLRHPGHVDLQCFPELKMELMQDGGEAVETPGPTLEFDTTAIEEERYEKFIAQVRQTIQDGSP